MSPLGDAFPMDRSAQGWGGRWLGVMPAIVTDLDDPSGHGRIRIRLPWTPDSGGGDYDLWARMATLFAGNDRGSWFLPDVGDEVLVAFEHGDAARPYVLGGLWNGKDAPPVAATAQNNIKQIKSRNGIIITLDDSQGQETLHLQTPGAQQITLKDGPGAISIEDSNGNSIKLESGGIIITAAAKVTVNAPQVEVSAAMVKVDAPMSRFSGVVQCDTLITTTCVATTYTPGAGNIW
jgi:uncharacterized protein involved in type VI secretion and phage assembly